MSSPRGFLRENMIPVADPIQSRRIRNQRVSPRDTMFDFREFQIERKLVTGGVI
jgi:hypothetical protein